MNGYVVWRTRRAWGGVAFVGAGFAQAASLTVGGVVVADEGQEPPETVVPEETGGELLEDRLEVIRLQVSNGWLDEAQLEIDDLVGTREGRDSAETWLIKADIHYRQYDIPNTLRALDHAGQVATGREAARVAEIRGRLQGLVGGVDVAIDSPSVVDLTPEVLPLDPYLRQLLERTTSALSCLGHLDRRATCREEAFGIVDVLDGAEGDGQQGQSTTDALLVRAYLPFGTYQFAGRTVEIGREIPPEAIRLGGRLPAISWSLGTGYRYLVVAGVPSLQSVFLGFEATGPNMGIELGGGMIWSANDDALVAVGGGDRVGKRPAGYARLFVPVGLGDRMQIQPSVQVVLTVWPLQQYGCTAQGQGSGAASESGTCYVDTVGTLTGAGAVWTFHGGERSGLRLRAELIGGATRLVPSEMVWWAGDDLKVTLTGEAAWQPAVSVGLGLGWQF